jgi:hypothetical protein
MTTRQEIGSSVVRMGTEDGVTTIDVRPSDWGRVGFGAAALLGPLILGGGLHRGDGAGLVAGVLFGLAFGGIGLWGFGAAETHRIDHRAGTVERVRRWGGFVTSTWRSALGGHARVDVRTNERRFEVWLLAEEGETMLVETPTTELAQGFAVRVRAALRAPAAGESA